MKQSWIPVATIVAILVVPAVAPRAQQAPAAGDPVITLTPTNHLRLPADLSKLWMAPSSGQSRDGNDKFAAAVKLEVDSNFAKALPMLSDASVQQGTLGRYAEYYLGLAQLRLGQNV